MLSFDRVLAAEEVWGVEAATSRRASEAFENIPASMKARESYTFTSADTFEEVFEIAEDGVAFQVYSRNMLTRV